MSNVGKQQNGMSPIFTKRMALESIKNAHAANRSWTAADVGGGWGELSIAIAPLFEKVYLLDFSPPQEDSLPTNVKTKQVDLNLEWPLEDNSVDFVLSCEVIEHVENPRHFLREMKRVARPGGYIFITTPNNHSLFSKVNFFFRGQHRYFQDSCYPAHITPLLRSDFERIGSETGLKFLQWYWSGDDRIPVISLRLPWRSQAFSASIGVLYQVPSH